MNRKYLSRAAVFIITGLLLTTVGGCTKQATPDRIDETVPGDNLDDNSSDSSADINYNILEAAYNADDLDSSWDADTAVHITCSENTVDIDGSGASADDGKITIAAAGTYIVSGSLSDGQIMVDAQSDDVVRIVLNQANISCTTSSAICAVQSKKVILTLAEGTENELADGARYIYDDAEADEPDAALFSKDDITINGGGSLKVTGNYQNGIRTKDHLIIVSGILDVTAVTDGIKGKDSITVKDGSITVHAGNDGIKSNNDSNPDKGYILLENGTYQITAGRDGIQAETVLQIQDGSYQITTGGGSSEAQTKRPDRMQPSSADPTQDTSDSVSMKGLKASGAIFITDGSLVIDSADDTVHSNGNITISEGSFTLSTGDDGVHADSGLTINGGTIDITESYEGLEALTIDINGGTIHLTASDDGINAAGGNDSGSDNGFGADMFAVTEDAYIRITDGYVYVNAEGDGVDSNGRLYMDGGILLVDGPVSGGNGALDYDGDAEITGGIVIAAGSSGMAENFSESSSQNSMLVYYSETQTAGTLLNLSDTQGNSIISYIPAKDYQSVVISCPNLETGGSYILSAGGEVQGEETDGYYGALSYSGGTTMYEILLDSTIITAGDTSGHQQGPGGKNPMGNGRPDRPDNNDSQPEPPSDDRKREDIPQA